MQRSALCRSRRELSNGYLLAKFGFDTAASQPAENEPCKVCPLSVYRSPRYGLLIQNLRDNDVCREANKELLQEQMQCWNRLHTRAIAIRRVELLDWLCIANPLQDFELSILSRSLNFDLAVSIREIFGCLLVLFSFFYRQQVYHPFNQGCKYGPEYA